ncbi:hypothetical protein [Streptomyces sp. NPDC046862]|uniref:hypothetical protein n=1 Tax=Streptomyces sp. NPDC046862 TaxID=3154603 RepID=UPI003451261C
MITRSDEGPDFEPDDPLAVILRPPSDHLGPPPGRYQTIRRTAARRRLLRAAAGVGVSCAVAAAVVLPLRLAAHEAPASPSVPLAPPPASSPPAEGPTPGQSTSPVPDGRHPSGSGASLAPSLGTTPGPTEPSHAPSPTPKPSVEESSAKEPSAVRGTGDADTP